MEKFTIILAVGDCFPFDFPLMQLVSHFVLTNQVALDTKRALCSLMFDFDGTGARVSVWACITYIPLSSRICWISSRCSFRHSIQRVLMLAHIHYNKAKMRVKRPTVVIVVIIARSAYTTGTFTTHWDSTFDFYWNTIERCNKNARELKFFYILSIRTKSSLHFLFLPFMKTFRQMIQRQTWGMGRFNSTMPIQTIIEFVIDQFVRNFQCIPLNLSLSLSLNECNMKTFIHKTLDKDSLSVNANHPISIDGCKCFPKWTVTTDRYNTLIRMLMGMAQLCVNPSDWAFLLIWHIFFFYKC